MKLFYDLVIITGIVSTALPAAILLYHRTRDKKSLEYRYPRISLSLSLVLLVGALALIWGSFVEPHILIVKHQTIDVPHIEKPVRIVLIADYQAGSYRKAPYIKRTVDKTLSHSPDLVLIAGDQIDNTTPIDEELQHLHPLQELADKVQTIAIHGNHEYGLGNQHDKHREDRLGLDVSLASKSFVEQLGISYPVNEMILVTSTPSPLYVFGGDEWWNETLDFGILGTRENTDIPTIGLIHNPAAAWEADRHGIDLMISGHTHGGQIRLPFIGPVGRVDNIIPADWYQGLIQVSETMQLYVTSGVGESGTRARLFNPPEIVILTLE